MRIIYCIFLLFTIAANSQTHSFEVRDNNIIWQKIYNDTTSINNLIKQLRNTGKFSSIETNGSEIFFTLDYKGVDFKPYGYKAMTDPIYLGAGGNSTGTIEFKEKKYRVYISRIEVNGALPSEKPYSLNDIMIKNDGTLRPSKTPQRGLTLYDALFSELFTAKSVKNEW